MRFLAETRRSRRRSEQPEAGGSTGGLAQGAHAELAEDRGDAELKGATPLIEFAGDNAMTFSY